jgi:hypothetical protein
MPDGRAEPFDASAPLRLERPVLCWHAHERRFLQSEAPMIIRTCAAIGAVVLIVAATVSSAFACSGAHARTSTMTKVSYAASVKQAR